MTDGSAWSAIRDGEWDLDGIALSGTGFCTGRCTEEIYFKDCIVVKVGSLPIRGR